MLILTLIVERVCRIACIIQRGIEVRDGKSQPSDLLKLKKGDAHRLAFLLKIEFFARGSIHLNLGKWMHDLVRLSPLPFQPDSRYFNQ
ncbi:hypothetical protein [Candidatus Nitrospira allomarina]|uniref:Uncharacterized protein n=1 Tax=Candidatus Nitrospira allomarina TaxID=3020900 RepID=A0AA96JT67_9BACT|nr:hypothetical protein [Candidatus Nitrospira allomarina]WNM59262.1 hypothetical protein PP769_05715 [Candidatus Nitrospira allomarina]